MNRFNLIISAGLIFASQMAFAQFDKSALKSAGTGMAIDLVKGMMNKNETSSEGNDASCTCSSPEPVLKECDAIFNPDKRFCYDGVIYDLCKGKSYDPTTHICSGDANSARVILSSALKLKECKVKFNANRKFCYDGIVYDLCDGMPYNPTTHICSGVIANRALCNGVQYNPLIQKCKNEICGMAEYNPITHGCSDNVIYPKCGAELYDPDSHVCKDNVVFPKCGETFYNPATQKCIENVVLGKCGKAIYDLTKQMCKNNVVLELEKCGETFYNPETHFCKDNNTVLGKCGKAIYDPTTQGCKNDTVLGKCGKILYDPAMHGCKNDVVVARCGATELYNPETHECSFGTVFPKKK